MVDSPNGQLQIAGLQTLNADPPIEETVPSNNDVKEVVGKIRDVKAAGISNISAELLKGGVKP